MAFTPLGKRLSQLPLVLAGPILRQVTHDAVTVWVALKQSATVTLNVWNTDKPQQGAKPLMTQATATTPIGVNLHIVAVTARAIGALAEGNIYFYNLSFMVGDIAINLSQAVTPTTTPPTPLIQNPFAYGTYALPSFALPPKDLTKLRLIHGSCRHPHAPGNDAMAILDDLIAQNATAAKPDAYARPHQLILSGDQIYADDVSDALLLMLTDAGDTLMGWFETLPFPSSTFNTASGLPPYKRYEPLHNAGFTSDDLRSHLLSLGEYFAMYLFVWSEVLWPDPKTFDTYAEIFAVSFPDLVGKPRYKPAGNRGQLEDTYPAAARTMVENAQQINAATVNLANFSTTVSKVRRALANIPTYMICDDHEVTDDWNMTRGFCEGVYSTTNQIGLRVAQNALVAYSVCQAWGNLPEQFAVNTPTTPGQQLLGILAQVTAAVDINNPQKAPIAYNTNSAKLMTLVGVHSDDVLKTHSPYRVFHDPPQNTITIGAVKVSDTSLRFNFSIEGDGHQVIVTDTRSWRAFPSAAPNCNDISHADFLPVVIDQASQPVAVEQLQLDTDVPGLDVQLNKSDPTLTGRLLLVVFTTNIPPTAGIRKAATTADYSKFSVYNHDLRDSWEFSTGAFDRMMAHLDKKVAGSKQPNSPVILLSGDVHFSFSSRLAYWVQLARFGDPPGQSTQSKRVFAQLVCSSFKNQEKKTLGMQDDGYTYHPSFYLAPFTPPFVSEGFVGWNAAVTAKQIFPNQERLFEATPEVPTWSNTRIAHVGNGAKIFTPDYRYRLDYLVTAQSGQNAPPPTTIASGASHVDAANATAVAAKAYTTFLKSDAKKPHCIGRNNLGEIGFSWNAAGGFVDQVIHSLHWQEPDESSTATPKPLLSRLSTYVISTDINDKNYLPIPAPGES